MRVSLVSWNLLGLGTPLVIAAIAIPALLNNLGNERFGIVALAWGLIGYAGALDLGIGRATTQRIAALLDERGLQKIPDVIATANRLTLVTGMIGMSIICLAALFDVGSLIKTANTPANEINNSILLLGLALPLQAVSATYKGVNEAYLNFRNISILRMALGAANFGLPYITSLETNRVDIAISSLVASRLIALLFFHRFSNECVSRSSSKKGKYSKVIALELFKFGGWFTVSSVISPLLVQADRFVIASVLGAAIVTDYVIPFELTTQTLILSGAITTVIFPAVSRLLVSDPTSAQRLFRQWLIRQSLAMLFILTTLSILLPDILTLWLNKPAEPSTIAVGRILCVGIFANSIGSMYFSLLHANLQSRATAFIHVMELPAYLIILTVLTKIYGIEGAAIAWSIRTSVDAILLYAACRRL